MVLTPDERQSIVSRSDYEPFGAPLSNGRERLSFIGKEQDNESSLGDYGVRKYDPTLGRFMSVDALSDLMPGSSPFHYCFNNPLILRDPSGLIGEIGSDGIPRFTTGEVVVYGERDNSSEEVIRDRKLEWMAKRAAAAAADMAPRAQGGGGETQGTFGLAIPIAATAAAADGPIPIGDILGAGVLAGAATYDLTQRKYITYTLTNGNGQIYVGRASGFGDPQSIMLNRYSGHHMRARGFGNPTLDRSAIGPPGYAAIRGREQQLIDFHGGIGSTMLGNSIRGVGSYNPFGYGFHVASDTFFGPLAPYTGW